jgi:uncharacterized membrane protein YgcG
MRMTMTARLIGGLIVMTALGPGAPVRAGDRLIYDFFSPYLQRYDGIKPGAGDAKEVNAATHVIDPWPPYVGNRHIPGDSERMANAVRRYRDVSKLPCAPPPIAPVQVEISNLTGSAGSSSSGVGGGGGGGADCSSSTSSGGRSSGGGATAAGSGATR